jgi:type I restriction enzyme S subunit
MEVREPSARYLVVQTGRGHPDWENVKLGAIASFRTGPFGTSLHKSDYVLGGVPVVNPMQIEDGRIKPTDRMSVAEQAADRLGEFRLKVGDVVIGRRGEMGRCAFVQDAQEGWLCGTGSMIVRPGAKLDGRFLQRVLSSNQAARAIESASVGTTMINLNQRTLADLSLHIPISIKEQAAIADALTASDALIESLEQLLTKKRQIKQGAMQELLTGKRRLPGFVGEWSSCLLGDVVAFLKGTGLSKAALTPDGSNPCIHYGQLFTEYGPVIDVVRSYTEEDHDSANSQVGDVLMPTSDVTPRGLAKASCILQRGVILGGDILILRPDDSLLHGPFLSNLIRSQPDRVLELVTGSTVFHLYGRDMAGYRLSLPKIEEQVAIVQVLSDLDLEVTALESRLTKAHALKQAMAQALLTGRIRLVEPTP